MKNTKEFADFLKAIRLSATQIEAAKEGHELLRDQLVRDEALKPMILTTFLQGSYRRSTIVKPQGEDRPDVDLVVVGRFDPRSPPDYVLRLFEPFVERHYKGRWERQGRSIGIKKSDVDLDLVITRKPPDELFKSVRLAEAFSDPLFNTVVGGEGSNTLYGDGVTTIEEAYRNSQLLSSLSDRLRKSDSQRLVEAQERLEAWRDNPLEIPDREMRIWAETHPMAQMEWTTIKNSDTNGFFVDTVRAIKWLRAQDALFPKYPKSYPLEHMVGDCCPDGIKSVAEGVTATLETMVERYRPHVLAGEVPVLTDHGCANANVLERVDRDDFAKFLGRMEIASAKARAAYDASDRASSSEGWRELFGAAFPTIEPNAVEKLAATAIAPALGGFTGRTQPTEDVSTTRFA